MRRAILISMLAAMGAAGQVVVNGGRTFLGPLDATNAMRTQPFRMGNAASRPATCLQGEVYFETDAPAGQNLQFCTAANVWTGMTGGTGGGGTGNMVNTGAATANALPRYTDTSGTALAPSSVTVDGSGNVVVPGTVTTGGGASGSVTLSGSASGGATITVAATSGTPADLVLPTATGASGQVLQTNGGTPQQLSWVTPSGEATSVSNSGASGASVLKTGTNVTARKLVAGANVTITENTDDVTISAASGGSGTSVTTKGDLQTHDGASATRLGAGADGFVLTADAASANGLKWAAAAGGGAGLSVTAKGDLQTHNGTAAARLGVGADGYVLTADGASPNGVKWAAATGGGGGVAEIAAGAKAWWWPFGSPQVLAANGTSTLLRTHIAAFTLPVKISVASIGFRVHTAAASGTAGATLGIYNGACDTLLLSVNKPSGLNVAGYYKAALGAPVVLNPGNYYMAWASDDATMQFSGAGLGSPMMSFSALMGVGSETFFYGTASTGAGATVTLPAACGSRGTPSSHGIPSFVLIP